MWWWGWIKSTKYNTWFRALSKVYKLQKSLHRSLTWARDYESELDNKAFTKTFFSSVMWRLPQGSIPVLVWTCSLRDSFHTTSSPFMFRHLWSSASPGCPSGWTTSQPPPGWRSPSPRCSPCPPPPPPLTALCPPWPTPRWGLRRTPAGARLSSHIEFHAMNACLNEHATNTWTCYDLAPAILCPSHISLTVFHLLHNCVPSGDRRVEQHLRLICIPRPAGVRPRQLRGQGRRQVIRCISHSSRNGVNTLSIILTLRIIPCR